MHIIVCIKQVPDPEGPRESFVINKENLCVEPRGIPPALSLFDENALEAALRIKDLDPKNVKVTVLSMGRKLSAAVLMKALAAGADELLKVESPAFDPSVLDCLSSATVLAAAVSKIGTSDLILVGRQAADWNAGQTGTFLAGLLNLPCITLAGKITVSGDEIEVERVQSDGSEIVKTVLPAVVMVSNEIGELRYPAMKARREAKKKPITSWTAADLDLGSQPPVRMKLKELYIPEIPTGRCEIISADNPEEAGRQLARHLHSNGLVPT